MVSLQSSNSVIRGLYISQEWGLKNKKLMPGKMLALHNTSDDAEFGQNLGNFQVIKMTKNNGRRMRYLYLNKFLPRLVNHKHRLRPSLGDKLYNAITYGAFTLSDTDTDTDKLAQNPMGICVGVCLCAVWRSLLNFIQPISISLFIGLGVG